MDFHKRMKQRLYIGIAYIVIGILLTLLALFRPENYFYSSFGLALAIMGVIRIIRYRKITANEQNMRKQELEETDERTRMIAERARSWSFSLSILICGILVIVLNLLGYHDQALPFAWYVCGMVCLYWLSWFVIQKKY